MPVDLSASALRGFSIGQSASRGSAVKTFAEQLLKRAQNLDLQQILFKEALQRGRAGEQLAQAKLEAGRGGVATASPNGEGGGVVTQRVNPITGETVKFPESIQFEADRAASIEAAKRASKLNEAGPLLNFIMVEASKIPDPGKGAERVFASIEQKRQSLLQLDANIAAYDSFLEAIKPQVARLLGDVGNLSQPEQEQAIQLLAKGRDSAELKAKKTANFFKFVIGKASFNTGRDAQEFAAMFGLQYDPVTQSVSSLQLDLLRNGFQVIFPEKPGGQLGPDAAGNFAIVFPDESFQEVKRVR